MSQKLGAAMYMFLNVFLPATLSNELDLIVVQKLLQLESKK